MRFIASRPSRARGLKLNPKECAELFGQVAPLAGAWIETEQIRARRQKRLASRPSRARGLKPVWNLTPKPPPSSRPSRARGLKLADDEDAPALQARRAPRGRVD